MKLCTVTTDQILLISGCFQNNSLRTFFFLSGMTRKYKHSGKHLSQPNSQVSRREVSPRGPTLLQVSFQLKQGELGVQQLLWTRFRVLQLKANSSPRPCKDNNGPRCFPQPVQAATACTRSCVKFKAVLILEHQSCQFKEKIPFAHLFC